MAHRFPVAAVWIGAVSVARSTQAVTFDALLSRILPIEVALFRIEARFPQPAALADDTVVVAGVGIGDVLAEELDVSVPYGSIVLIRHETAFQNLSFELGAAVAEILSAVMERAFTPTPAEAEIFAALAQNCLEAVGDMAEMEDRLSVRTFRDGLMQTLMRSGARASAAHALMQGLTSAPRHHGDNVILYAPS